MPKLEKKGKIPEESEETLLGQPLLDFPDISNRMENDSEFTGYLERSTEEENNFGPISAALHRFPF